MMKLSPLLSPSLGSPATRPRISRNSQLSQGTASDTFTATLRFGNTQSLKKPEQQAKETLSALSDPQMPPAKREALTAILKQSADLTTLDLGGAHVNGTNLACLQYLPNLTTLDLGYTAIRNSALKCLQKLPNLTTLSLMSASRVDAKGLKSLSTILPNLTALDLQYSPVTDAGIKNLAGLTKLTTLNLRGTFKITDTGIESLKHLPQLTTLLLGYGVTETGLKSLSKALPNLETLDLRDTQIELTDAGRKSLQRFSKLKTLFLWDATFSPKQLQPLQTALPQCDIQYLPQN